MSQNLFLFNTLSREKELFLPVDPAHVRVYACGPTVYDVAHIGNARMAVAFDLLVRVLRTQYPQVTYVSNITDVDDKIMAAAAQSGDSIEALTRRFEGIYNADMAALGVQQPDIQPRATEHIGEMIALIDSLIRQGHAYAAEGHVLFHVPSFPAYGSLSGRNRDDQIAGARVEVAPFKKDPADFVLWKPSTGSQVGWDSPWGFGRPGWHIECSAMAERHLGLPFDIHGGGADLKFPHHENEIAQSCCAHGDVAPVNDFARYWIHNGFVTVEGEKMSKSLGNFVTAHDLLERWPGEVLRLTLLSAHYRQPLDWTEEGLNQAKRNLDRLYQALDHLAEGDIEDGPAVPQEILEPLLDDLNTPKALAALYGLTREANAAITVEEKTRAKGKLLGAGYLLGLLREDPKTWLGYGQGTSSLDIALIEELLEKREQARKTRDFKAADTYRDQVLAMGVQIEDTASGPRWKT